MTLDAPVDVPDSDGSPSALGIFVTWKPKPSLPGKITDQINVSKVKFQMSHVQLIGDAGIPTHSRLGLTWDKSEEPADEEFPDAPVGLYSKVTLDINDFNNMQFATDIEGTVQDGNNNKTQFQILDTDQLMYSFDLNQLLPAGGSATITVVVALKDALSAINFSDPALKKDKDGVLQVVGPPLMMFHTQLQMNGFKLDTTVAAATRGTSGLDR